MIWASAVQAKRWFMDAAKPTVNASGMTTAETVDAWTVCVSRISAKRGKRGHAQRDALGLKSAKTVYGAPVKRCLRLIAPTLQLDGI